MTSPTQNPRWQITSRDLLEGVMTYPIRGEKWSIGGLADVVGVPKSLIQDLLRGKQRTVKQNVAIAIGRATVGDYPSTLVLFTPVVSNESDTEAAA